MMGFEEFGDKYLIHMMKNDEFVETFDCGDSDLNDFILRTAPMYREDFLAVTYVLATSEDPDKIVGFCSLAHDNVSMSDFESKTEFNRFRRSRRIPHAKIMESYPAIKVCRLGVDLSLQQHGAGTKLLNFVKSIFTDAPYAGCRFMTVDAYPDAIPFYEKNGFHMLRDINDESKFTRPLYFDLKRII